MVYFTGDIHGEPWRIIRACQTMHLSEKDVVVMLGDVGANYYGDYRDECVKTTLSKLGPTLLCIHGNHEMRPQHVAGYHMKVWHNGMVWAQDDYPNLLFAMDGEVFTINGLNYIVIGGAYSVDKNYRIARGYGWWDDEQPSAETKEYVEQQIRQNHVDVILSHTCPFKYEPREMFLPMVDQSTVDASTEKWLDEIEERTDYKAWFCGHWHTDKRIDKMHFLYRGFESEADIPLPQS